MRLRIAKCFARWLFVRTHREELTYIAGVIGNFKRSGNHGRAEEACGMRFVLEEMDLLL